MELTEPHPPGQYPFQQQETGVPESSQDLAQVQAGIAERLQAGDPCAAEELTERYYQRIYLYMRELGHSRETSEDLTQEAFFRAWQHIAQLRSGRALSAWLFRIASNVSCEFWRKQHRRDTVTSENLNLIVPELSIGRGQDVQAGRLEELKRVLAAVGDLSWKLRQAVVLHYLQGFTISEAAEAAGIKEGTFKSRLNRALEALRQNLDNEDFRR
jgi:RNA polymerase sigma-70 factor (ECF subfamily)